jgi:hypothetical protein
MKKRKEQSSFDLGVPKQKRRYVERGFMKDIETKALADRLRRDFQKDGYEVKINSYVTARQKWWRLSFKR